MPHRQFRPQGGDKLKRFADVTISAVGLAVTAPVLAVAAVAIRAETRGPTIFRQTRIGLHECPFTIYKLRTMHDRRRPIDQMREAVLSDTRDARITRVGRLLRATSLDEIPQLVNVLKGDMSLVGPRPVLPEQLQAIPTGLRQRFDVRPGITGLAQIRGRRELDWLQQITFDCEYVREHNPALDLKILFRTIAAVTTRSSIYGDEGKNWRAYLPSEGEGKDQ